MKDQKARSSLQQGFTLVEILVVLGILAVLLAITIVAINPAKQFGQANDTKRRSDANSILNAIGQYQVEHSGSLPTSVASLIAGTNTAINSTNLPTLCGQIVPTYISALPADPVLNNQAGISTCSGSWDTGYQVSRDAANRVTISAPSAYSGTIQLTR